MKHKEPTSKLYCIVAEAARDAKTAFRFVINENPETETEPEGPSA